MKQYFSWLLIASAFLFSLFAFNIWLNYSRPDLLLSPSENIGTSFSNGVIYFAAVTSPFLAGFLIPAILGIVLLIFYNRN